MSELTPDGLPVVSKETLDTFVSDWQRPNETAVFLERFLAIEKENPFVFSYFLKCYTVAKHNFVSDPVSEQLFLVQMMGVYELLVAQARANKLADDIKSV